MKYKKGVYYAYPTSDIAEQLHEKNGCFYVAIAQSFWGRESIILAHSENMLEIDGLASRLDLPWWHVDGVDVKGEYWFLEHSTEHCIDKDTK